MYKTIFNCELVYKPVDSGIDFNIELVITIFKLWN